jgi:fibrillarin-like pre-rRNA processing protein
VKSIRPGIFRHGGNLYTENAAPGEQVYGEPLVESEGAEYRRWVPSRSKLAAAVESGADLGLRQDSEVVYLGAASGTTVSHVSDIVSEGFVTAVEFSRDVARDLLGVAEARENVAPVVADARRPEKYQSFVEGPDVLVQDVSQRDQVEIFERNAERLFDSGRGLLVVKAGAIDSSAEPEEVFEQVEDEVSVEVEDFVDLSPFYTDQCLLVTEI